MRPSVVTLRALGLGDLLTAVPALRAVADAFPGHSRVLVAPTALAPLARLSGAVDAVVPGDIRRPLTPPPGRRPDVAVNLHGRGPQSHRRLLDLAPARLVGFACPAAGVAGPPWRAGEHERERWCRLLREVGIPASAERFRLPRPAGAPGARPAVGDRTAVVHPGAGSASRRWPVARFAAVARILSRGGSRVLVTGAEGERRLAQAVADAAGLRQSAVIAGRTDVMELARVVAGSSVVVSGDTGIAHLAVAFGTPTVTLFGPVDPALWGPPASPRHRVLWAGGGPGDPHGDSPDPALLRIGVDAVARELAAVGRWA